MACTGQISITCLCPCFEINALSKNYSEGSNSGFHTTSHSAFKINASCLSSTLIQMKLMKNTMDNGRYDYGAGSDKDVMGKHPINTGKQLP